MMRLFLGLVQGEKRSIVGLCEHLRRKEGAKRTHQNGYKKIVNDEIIFGHCAGAESAA